MLGDKWNKYNKWKLQRRQKTNQRATHFLEAIMRPQLSQLPPQKVDPDFSILELLHNFYKLEKGLVVKYNRLGVKTAKF